MPTDNWLELFPGIETLFSEHTHTAVVLLRIGLIILGMVLVYLGKKGTLEPLLMIPMGFGMLSVNSAVLFLDYNHTVMGTIFLDPMVSSGDELISLLQVDFLQPIYTFTFSNGLIACFVFMGIGVLLDVGYVLARPFQSFFLALAAELGTIVTFPVAYYLFDLSAKDSASVALIGGADGPMVIYTSMILSPKLFVAISVVAYLYLGLTYGGYPFMIRALIPKNLRAIPMSTSGPTISSAEKLAFAVVGCALLCLLFPAAAPLFTSLFLGVAIRESGIKEYTDFIAGPLLYGSTFFLGFILGVLCNANTLLQGDVLKLLILGIFALFMSGIGGIMGGYVLWFFSGGKVNPVVGIAGVSCIPTTAKVAQKEVSKANKAAIVLPSAVGASIAGVITTAIICGIYVAFVRSMQG